VDTTFPNRSRREKGGEDKRERERGDSLAAKVCK
jgi:hypothetical protein